MLTKLPRQVGAEMVSMWAHYDPCGVLGNTNVLRYLLGREPTTIWTAAQRSLHSRA